MKMKVLVADDSALFRRIISDSLAAIPGVQVVGSASTGQAALQKARELSPDLITLDMEMPGMCGLDVLDALKAEGIKANVILVSALTLQGGTLTMQALAKGAFDFITKPDGEGYEQNRNLIRAELAPRVRALANRLEVRSILSGELRRSAKVGARPVGHSMPTALPRNADLPAPARSIASTKPEIVLIGVSTGGPNALQRVLSLLPGDLGIPVVIVQHMPPLFTRTLAENLCSSSLLNVSEAVDGDVLRPNRVYIAPGGRQMRVVPGANRAKTIQITDDPPENNCRPAVDYLFRSVANHFPGEAMAVILTGMGSDGTIGLRMLKRHGCKVLAQDETSCVVFGMPKAAIDAGVVDAVLPLDEIAPRIASVVRGVCV